MPLAIHSRVRDMTLSITLYNFTLGATTKESLINKRVNISQNPDCYIIFVKVQMRKGKNLAKRCLLHCLRSPPPPHTHNTTLHTGMMLTRGIYAFVVCYQRRIIITHDLDIYKCALQIQQSVVNTNWILQAVFCLSVYCMCCPT